MLPPVAPLPPSEQNQGLSPSLPCPAPPSSSAASSSSSSSSTMRDGQGCLLPVLPCQGQHRLPPEEGDPFIVSWSFPPKTAFRAEAQPQLAQLETRHQAKKKKKAKRDRHHLAKANLHALPQLCEQGSPMDAASDSSPHAATDSTPTAYTDPDTSFLPGLDDNTALRCLAFVPCADHWRLAALSRRHQQLVQSRLLFELRRCYGVVEQWVCMYTSGDDGWTAFDPKQHSWRNLPHADVDPNFDLSDRESLSAGPHLLWLGKEAFDFACYKYDLAGNRWERGPPMVNPRCLFASASCGEFAFVAGGFSVGGLQLSVLNTAERYDSRSGQWEPLPPMPTCRHKCSGFFMDGKFYVIGGKDKDHQPLTSAEEYDPVRGTWRTIENMYVAPAVAPAYEPSPPLVAVANNHLYSLESATNLLKVYEKSTNTWKALGPVPVRADFCNGWGLAFKALGDELFVIGGHRTSNWEREGVAVFSWRPRPDATAPEWRRLDLRARGNGTFLYNCAVISC